MTETSLINSESVLNKINSVGTLCFSSLEFDPVTKNFPLFHVLYFNKNNVMELSTDEIDYLIFNSDINQKNWWKMNALMILIYYGDSATAKVSKKAINYMIKNTDLSDKGGGYDFIINLVSSQNKLNLSTEQIDEIIISFVSVKRDLPDFNGQSGKIAANLIHSLAEMYIDGKNILSEKQVLTLLDHNPWIDHNDNKYSLRSTVSSSPFTGSIDKINLFLKTLNTKETTTNDGIGKSAKNKL